MSCLSFFRLWEFEWWAHKTSGKMHLFFHKILADIMEQLKKICFRIHLDDFLSLLWKQNRFKKKEKCWSIICSNKFLDCFEPSVLAHFWWWCELKSSEIWRLAAKQHKLHLNITAQMNLKLRVFATFPLKKNKKKMRVCYIVVLLLFTSTITVVLAHVALCNLAVFLTFHL